MEYPPRPKYAENIAVKLYTSLMRNNTGVPLNTEPRLQMELIDYSGKLASRKFRDTYRETQKGTETESCLFNVQ